MRRLVAKAMAIDDEDGDAYRWRLTEGRCYTHLSLSASVSGTSWGLARAPVFTCLILSPLSGNLCVQYCDKTLDLFTDGLLVLSHTAPGLPILGSGRNSVGSGWRFVAGEDRESPAPAHAGP